MPLLEHSISTEYTLYSEQKMRTSGENVYSTTLNIEDLFANELGNQEIRFSLGIVLSILIILTPCVYKKVNFKHRKIYNCFLILSCITLIMCTELFPWKIMPKILTVIQFAWRNIGFFTFFASLICGINTIVFAENILKKEIMKDSFIFGIIISIFVFAFLGVYRDWRFDDISLEKELDRHIKNNSEIEALQINREYLPLKAMKNIKYLIDRENCTYVLKGNAEIISEKKNKLTDIINLSNVSEGTILELPYLYYLGYNATITYDNSTEVLKITESNNGFLSVKIPECKNAIINIKYTGTILERVSYIISIIGIIIFLLYIIKEGKVNDREEKHTNI